MLGCAFLFVLARPNGHEACLIKGKSDEKPNLLIGARRANSSAMSASPDAPFDPAALRDASGVRAALQHANYTAAEVSCFLQGAQPDKDAPLLRRRTAGSNDPFHLAMRLFLLGEALDERTLCPLFAPGQIQELTDAGLLAVEGGERYGSIAQLAPVSGGTGWLLSDFTLDLAALADDHVLGVGAASHTLAALTPRRPFRRALDLGCGAGCQTLLAAAHCEHVVGTDLNARALHFARLNARLNGVANVEFRAGSFFAPVAGERFDLLVANPPFVISPENDRIFRTGSAQGDAVSEHVVREAPAYLEDGGMAIILLNWHHQDADDWPGRPVSWVENNGCDNWLLQFDANEPLVYAAEWLRTEGKTGAALGDALDRWSAYYQGLGLARISAGAFIMRRRHSSQNWTRADALPFGKHAGKCGAHVERVLAGETLAREATDDQLLAGRFHLHPDHLVDTHLRCEPTGWTQGPLTLRPQPGLDFPGRLDGPLLQILGTLDGTRTLAEALSICASQDGLTANTLTVPALGALRKLLRAGLLVVSPEENATALFPGPG